MLLGLGQSGRDLDGIEGRYDAMPGRQNKWLPLSLTLARRTLPTVKV